MPSNPRLVSETNHGCDCDRAKALKDFDDTKGGVKGLVDAGIAKLPRIFLVPPEEVSPDNSDDLDLPELHVPTVDLRAIHADPMQRSQTLEEVRHACETWGFFQVVNHGIAQDTLDETIEGVRRFREGPNETKAEFYTRDRSRKVRFNSNFDLYHSKLANWRDTLLFSMAPTPPEPQEFPTSCRDIMLRYADEVKKLGRCLYQLISEALGLEPDFLEDMDCVKGQMFDQVGGLQVLHQNRWVDVPPLRGALVVNVGGPLQLVSNDMFKSVEHRVEAKSTGQRISISCFFTSQIRGSGRVYGPIKELLTEESPAVFKETLMEDFINSYHSLGLGVSALDLLRL